jgi:hypothetical protein
MTLLQILLGPVMLGLGVGLTLLVIRWQEGSAR